jgi:hypothetical protein
VVADLSALSLDYLPSSLIFTRIRRLISGLMDSEKSLIYGLTRE